jgi:hypothetical protein
MLDRMLTLVMPTIVEREQLRGEALASIVDQDTPFQDVLVSIDERHDGVIPTINQLADRVETEFLFPFADDDLLLPHHVETLAARWDGRADIVYTWCTVKGGRVEPDRWQVTPAEKGGIEGLRYDNWIPASAAIRTSLWRQLGGYQATAERGHEDWDFWIRALDAGARFQCIPEVTWIYRLGYQWPHLSQNGRTPAGQFIGARI